MSEIILPDTDHDIYKDFPQIHFLIHEFAWKVDMEKIEKSLKGKVSEMGVIRLRKDGKLYRVMNITKDEHQRTQIEITEITFIA